jgi:hypothetical protein
VILAGAEHHLDTIAEGINERVNFGRQSAAGSADGLRARFLSAGAMLVSARDGGVNHHVFVVVIASQELEKPARKRRSWPIG